MAKGIKADTNDVKAKTVNVNSGLAKSVEEEEPQLPDASFFFREKSKVQPKGYDGLGIDEEVTVVLKGRVLSLGVNRWEKGKRFEIEIGSCDIVKKPQPKAEISLADAVKEADFGRKKIV
jgi:hypothetical protein